jgi:arsenate reductase (thioredoxin)
MIESVLFVCEDNSILGPMAEAFLRRHGKNAYRVFSAGILPKSIHLYTFQVMEEVGYDLYGYRAKSIFELNHLEHVDFLITLSDMVNEYIIFNKDHIGAQLYWPFRNPFHVPGTENNSVIHLDNSLPFYANQLPQADWPSSRCVLVDMSRRTRVIPKTTQTPPKEDTKEVLTRFRRIRDEMECQVMNWLEDEGKGQFWWRG